MTFALVAALGIQTSTGLPHRESRLTGDGQALAPRLRPVFGRVTRQLFTGFSDAEIGVLTTMLERMRGNLASTATARPG